MADAWGGAFGTSWGSAWDGAAVVAEGGRPGYLIPQRRQRRRREILARTSFEIPVGAKVTARCRYLPAPRPQPVAPVEVPAPPPLREPRTYTCRAVIPVGVHWRGNARRRYTDELEREARRIRFLEEALFLGLPPEVIAAELRNM